MIYATPGDQYSAVITEAPAGLVGTITAGIENPDGTTHTAQSSAGIVEIEPGIYLAVRTAPAPAEATTFVHVWKHGAIVTGEDLYVGLSRPEASPDPLEVTWRPAVEEVGAILRARTKTTMGDEAGTFNDNTRPTAEQVELLIDRATAHVASRVGTRDNLCPGSDESDELTSRARGLAALYTAMLIELSYFPEQINTTSPYKEYKILFDDGMKSLAEAVADTCGEGEGAGDEDSPASSSWDFPKQTVDLGMNLPW